MTGLDLKLRRVAADVKGVQLAQAMGVSPSLVSRVEGQRVVQPEMADRYLSALSTLTNVSSSPSPLEVAS